MNWPARCESLSIYSIGLYEMARIVEQFEASHTHSHIHLDYMRPDKVYEAVVNWSRPTWVWSAIRVPART